MRVRTRCALMAGAVVLAATVPDRIGAQAPQRRDSIFQSAGTAVVVDVIVRDSRGRPVRGLTLPDFDVREDGVRQTLQAIEGTADALHRLQTARIRLGVVTSGETKRVAADLERHALAACFESPVADTSFPVFRM